MISLPLGRSKVVDPLRGNTQERSDRPPPVSPAEYWAFLSIAMLLAVAFLAPVRSGSKGEPQNALGTGAFGAKRSTDEPRVIQHKRAHEPGRGRHADAPWQIPLRGWKDILWRTYQQIGEDRLLAVAAGVVFYGLLALFPAVTALVSLYGLFANASAVNDQLSSLSGILPSSALDILHEQIARLTSKGDTKLGFGFVVGLGVALWSANAGMKAIIDALNVVYEEKEKRGFIKLNLVSLAFTLAAIASLLLALGAVVVLPLVLNQLGLSAHHRHPFPCCALAASPRFGHHRLSADLPLGPEPTGAAVAVANGREHFRCRGMARQLRAALLVSGEFRPLRRRLWVSWSRDRFDDVDVGVLHRHSLRSAAQFRDRASNR